MKIQVTLFAAARQLVGKPSIAVEIAECSSPTVRDLRLALAIQHPELKQILASSAFAVDQEYADDNDSVSENCEVALIPPVSGG
jgi:molybdopterin converting factor subunit 1